MSSQAETDYEKQFQEDLIKATALSLEQQALDDYRRAKKYGTASTYYERSHSQSPSLTHSHSLAEQRSSDNEAYRRRRQQYSSECSTENTSTRTLPALAKPPSQPHRRYSEVGNTPSTAAPNNITPERSRTPPPSLLDSDLISFSSPTSKQPEHNTFEQLIEDLSKLQTNNPQTALVPLGPTAAAPVPVHPGYRLSPPTAMYATAAMPPPQYGSACMQLVPFTPPPQQQKVPLTNAELQKLYSMPPQHMAPYSPHARMSFIPPAGVVYPPQYTQSAPPTAAVAAAYMPPQYPPTARYGFHYNAAASGSSTPTYYAQSSTSSATSLQSMAAANAAAQPVAKSQSASAVNITNGLSAASLRRQTPPPRKPQRTGDDLIDLTQEDDSRVSVLEAFDPLLNEGEEVRKK